MRWGETEIKFLYFINFFIFIFHLFKTLWEITYLDCNSTKGLEPVYGSSSQHVKWTNPAALYWMFHYNLTHSISYQHAVKCWLGLLNRKLLLLENRCNCSLQPFGKKPWNLNKRRGSKLKKQLPMENTFPGNSNSLQGCHCPRDFMLDTDYQRFRSGISVLCGNGGLSPSCWSVSSPLKKLRFPRPPKPTRTSK